MADRDTLGGLPVGPDLQEHAQRQAYEGQNRQGDLHDPRGAGALLLGLLVSAPDAHQHVLTEPVRLIPGLLNQ